MFRDWNFFDFSPLLVFADTKDILAQFASERHKTSSLKGKGFLENTVEESISQTNLHNAQR